MTGDTKTKSFLKGISWRIVGTIDTVLVSFFLTNKFAIAISIGGVEMITKIFLFYFHERLWNKYK